MRKALLLILGAMLLLVSLNSCSYRGVAWRGRYWQHIEKNGVYLLKKDVLWTERPEFRYQGWWDGVAWSGADSSHTEGTMAKGTLLRIDKVYVDHSPLQYFSINYTAVVESGEHQGKRVLIKALLDGPSSAEYAARLRPDILEKVSSD